MTIARSFIGLSVTCLAHVGCVGGSSEVGEAHFPTDSGMSTSTLPSGHAWEGVYFINDGTRGYLHIVAQHGGAEYIGCWIGENKGEVAKFKARARDNVMMFDWTQWTVGLAAPAKRSAAYLVMTVKDDGKDAVTGKYGNDLTSDEGGGEWSGVREVRNKPDLAACRLKEGETPESESPAPDYDSTQKK